jgi:hypothetical protein
MAFPTPGNWGREQRKYLPPRRGDKMHRPELESAWGIEGMKNAGKHREISFALKYKAELCFIKINLITLDLAIC